MLKVFCFAQGGSGHFAGRVFIDNGNIDFGAEHTTVDAVDSWTDLKTHSQQATAWTVVMASEKVRVVSVHDEIAYFEEGFATVLPAA